MAFIAGAVAGAAAALLMAPDSGEKTRERIRNGASEIAEDAKKKILEKLEALEVALEDK